MAETGNAYHKLSSGAIQKLQDLANQLRIHSIQATSASNSGHPTSCCSMAEIMSVLFFHTMKYKVSEPKDPANDRFILSKGHAAPILYAAWAEAGLFPKEDLLNLRKISSDLEGHPTPRLNFVDVATGSLGQGLSCAAGMAYVGKYLDKADYRVYCLLGDGESAEGSVWEAMAFAHHYKLNNLVAIFDVNRLGQSEATMLKHNLEDYRRRAEAFGFKAIIVDGHDVSALVKAFDEAAASSEQPVAIIAQTFKGKNIPDAEDKDNCHGKPMGKATDSSIQHINSLINNTAPHGITPASPTKSVSPPSGEKIALCDVPQYKLGDNIATRLAYGTALVKIGKNHQQVIALDGDTKNSTFSQKFRDAYPERFIECFIAEQNMVGVAVGAGCRDRTVPFVSTFAAFLTRGFDQIRMAAVSQTNINLCGSHCGVSIGADGPSQMALEDLAMFRTVPNCTVFYPSDAVSTERAVELAANTRGMCFIRTTRANTPVIYGNDDKFEIGKCKVVEQSDSDQVTVIGAGITLLEARKASEQLKQEGIRVRIVDPFTIKPIDAVGIRDAVRSTAGRVVTVEDHYAEGGIGEAVAGCLSEERDVVIHRLHVTDVPRSGEPQELLEMFGIDSTAIVNAVKQTIKL